MAEHRLDEADVGAVYEHLRRDGVTKQVTRAGLVDPGAREVFLDQIRELVVAKRGAEIADEHVPLVGFHHQPRPHVIPIFADPRAGPLSDRDLAVLLALALADQHRAGQ